MDLYDAGWWFQLSRKILAIQELDGNEVILLSYLCNKRNYEKVDEGGWFVCSSKKIQYDLFWSDRKQTRWIGSLKDRGLISTKRKGLPAQRFLKVNFEILHEEVEKAIEKSPYTERGTSPAADSGSIVPLRTAGLNIKKENISKRGRGLTTSSAPSDGGGCFFPSDGKGKEDKKNKTYAVQLKKHIPPRLGSTSYNLSKWMNEFRKLRKEQGDEKVEEVFQWYCANADSFRYMPHVTSAAKFRAKFPRLVELCEKDKTVEVDFESLPLGAQCDIEYAECLDWPKDSKKQLRSFIAQNYAAYEKFIGKLNRAFERMKAKEEKALEGRTRYSSNEIQSWRLETALEWIGVGGMRFWIEIVYNRVSNWEAWDGRLDSFVWNPGHRDYLPYIHKLVDGKDNWNWILEKVNS